MQQDDARPDVGAGNPAPRSRPARQAGRRPRAGRRAQPAAGHPHADQPERGNSGPDQRPAGRSGEQPGRQSRRGRGGCKRCSARSAGSRREHLAPIERELTTAIKGAQVDLADAAEGQANPSRPQNPAVRQALADAGGASGPGDPFARSDARRSGRVGQLSPLRPGRGPARSRAGRVEAGDQQVAGRDARQRAEGSRSAAASRPEEAGQPPSRIWAGGSTSCSQQMDEVRGRLDESDPLAGSHAGRRLAPGRGSGHERPDALGRRARSSAINWARPAALSSKPGKDLDEMLDILANRREHELGRLLKKLRRSRRGTGRSRKQHAGSAQASAAS